MSTREYLIWSIEHDAWWRPARCGYTTVLSEAGRYSFVEASKILTRANYIRVNECLIPIDCVSPTGPDRVHCMRCGKCVSGFDPELGLVVRAWVECPECLEQSGAIATEDA